MIPATTFLIALIVLLQVLDTHRADGTCPSPCVCQGASATCERANIQIAGRFPENISSVTIHSKSRLQSISSKLFGRGMKKIDVRDSVIENILGNTFSHMPMVEKIEFRDSKVKTIDSCAFQFLGPSTVVIFLHTQITHIKAGAFSNIKGKDFELHIKGSWLDHINSNAFFNLRPRIILINDSNILDIQTSAFRNIQDVKHLEINQCVIDRVKNGAFNNFMNLDRVSIRSSVFAEVQCNALMELRESVTDKKHFTFTSSNMTCNCSTVQMLSYVRSYPDSVSGSVLCAPQLDSENAQWRPMKMLSVQDMCPDSHASFNSRQCRLNDPDPPTCLAETDSSALKERTTTPFGFTTEASGQTQGQTQGLTHGPTHGPTHAVESSTQRSESEIDNTKSACPCFNGKLLPLLTVLVLLFSRPGWQYVE